MSINILCIGDVVGQPGRMMLADHLPDLIREHQLELVVCNAENAAGGSGLTPAMFRKLLHYGVDVVTLGDHVYKKLDIAPALHDSDRIVRPANLSPRAAGRRWTVVPTKSGEHHAAVCCLLGQMFMGHWNSPWLMAEDILQEMPADVKLRIFDFHAEATSEKVAMGWHLNGRASVVFGTHTHIPTADERVLGGGTAFISDVGMTGPYDSVLGRKKDRVLAALRTNMPHYFEVASGDPRISGVLVSVNPETGVSESIERIQVCGRKPQPEGGGDSRAEPAEEKQEAAGVEQAERNQRSEV